MIIMDNKSEVDEIIYIDGRSWPIFYARIKAEVKFPATLLSIGLKSNGFPFAIFKTGVTVPTEPASGPIDPSIPVVKVEEHPHVNRRGPKKKLVQEDEYTIKSSDEFEGEANSL
jgi:hypothetical protein